MRFARAVLMLVALVSAGCASRLSHDELDQEAAIASDPEIQQALSELETAKDQLNRSRAASDCSEIRRVAGLICSASERICAIAKRHPDERAYSTRCDAARRDCADASRSGSECR